MPFPATATCTEVTEDDWLVIEHYLGAKNLTWKGFFLLAGVNYRRGYAAYKRARDYGKAGYQRIDWALCQNVLIEHPTKQPTSTAAR